MNSCVVNEVMTATAECLSEELMLVVKKRKKIAIGQAMSKEGERKWKLISNASLTYRTLSFYMSG